ncbi:hypothetical protein [Tautonia sociabilis]|uniref:hypothetical protein n=1 Tax=Tautonia sociabilis TaxID=2080755 RepID=UPI001F2698B0|nr:hypothetical protein [Tautonia sociabilis]
MGRFISITTIGMVVVSMAFLGAGCSQSSAPPTPAETASVAGEDAGLYCKEHGVPEKFCTLCHAELANTLMLCTEHGGIPEDICTLCHPEAEKKYDLVMCPKGHGLPQHFCTECAQEPAA